MTPEEIRRLLTKEPHSRMWSDDAKAAILSLLHVIKQQQEALADIMETFEQEDYSTRYSSEKALTASAEYADLAREQLSGKEET